jgi:hypothetical protein
LMVPVSNAASHLSASRHRQATGVSERTAASATKSRHPVASKERRSTRENIRPPATRYKYKHTSSSHCCRPSNDCS